MKSLAFLIALAAPLSVQAQDTGALVRFVTCPVYRDTDAGRKSGCWLAQQRETGKRYDVSLSPYKPDWNYAVLVEGRVSDASPAPCGDTVLDPVRTSRLYDVHCTRHMLPAEGYPGRRYKLHGRYINPLSVPRKVPPGPYSDRTFTAYFEFGNDFLIYQYDDYLIDKATTWIRAAKPKKLIVTGFAATDPVEVSGMTLAEPADLAQQRAETIAETMRRLVPDVEVETRWKTGAKVTDDPDTDTIPGQSRRRVEIHAVF
ncbi:hypothetical protein RXV95_11455 [Novosphingobium sp. ZN18A2]|uniref:hypothetical protein n=1 Tax=Novosphingobium sp. ZN18A2 TaxID=3079861 RepID=UPI0030D576D0